MKSLFYRSTVGFMLGYVTFFPSPIICGDENSVPSPQTEYYSFCGEQTSADYKDMNSRGFFYYEAGDFASAIRCYQMSLAINPQFAVAHNNIGAAYLRIGTPDLAENHFREAIALEPTYVKALLNLAKSIYKKDKLEARDYFMKAWTLHPDYVAKRVTEYKEKQGLQ